MKTLKAVVAKYNQTSLILRILIGLAVGSVLALVAPGAGWVGELGSLFVGALKGIAPVLVFVIVASALAQGSSKLDRRFGTVIWLYMLTTFLAAAIAVITSFMFPVKVVLADAAQSDVIPQGLGEVLSLSLIHIWPRGGQLRHVRRRRCCTADLCAVRHSGCYPAEQRRCGLRCYRLRHR